MDDNVSRLEIKLSAEEASDVLNFVLKDEATNTWYDNSGSNFRLPLHGEVKGAPPEEQVRVDLAAAVVAALRLSSSGALLLH